ncbi:MAG: hypothetical protein IKD37_08540 [Clostridia bacterium]|nr:hypothetical protein [Clostridia bacterium]
MKDNAYFNRFLQYFLCNLIAALCYFLLAAALGAAGAIPEGNAARALSALVTAIPFALAVLVATLREADLPRGEGRIAAYFAGAGRGDIATYAVWALIGGVLALAGEGAGVTIYLFLAQTLPAASLCGIFGNSVGLILAVCGSMALYIGARVLGVAARR